MIRCNDQSLRFVGRWKVTEDKAVTTVPGSHFYLAFEGKSAVLHFETMWLIAPYPHLWISVDDGAWIEVPIEKHLRIQARTEGNHVVKVVYKSAIEKAHRWYLPLCGCAELVGVDAKPGVLPEFHQKTIEFVGDSITEGVLIDEEISNGTKYHGRPYQDDVMAGYSWLSVEALNLEPLYMGYGAVGVTRSGQGSVPRACESYPYCFHNEKIEYSEPDYILINHGANDQFDTEENFVKCYMELLDVIMGIHPHSTLILLQPFCGVFKQGMILVKEQFEKKYEKTAHLILTEGWIPAEPLHPHRDGHQIVAEHLIHELVERGIVEV